MTNKFLLVHHAKNFQSNNCYLSDDFFEANRQLFGAQELDTWAGYRFLQSFGPTYRLQISHNLGKFQLVKDEEVLEEDSITNSKTFGMLPSKDYLNALLIYWDTSIAYNAIPSLKALIQKIIIQHQITLVWSDTQFYDALLPKTLPTVVRSVNFEPFHVMREDPTWLRYLRRLGKAHSEKIISNSRTLISISPRDLYFYKAICDKDIEILPLRQLPFLLQNCKSGDTNLSDKEFDFPFIYFAGSNFDIKHNLDNLQDIIQNIAPTLESLFPDLRILIFGHKFPEQVIYPDNVIKMYFRNDFHSIIQKSLAAIVPSPGGSGMQSKIFEPMCLGIPLIANPEAFSDFPFHSGRHYLGAKTTAEILQKINYVLTRRDESILIARRASLLCESIFRREFYTSTIERVLFNEHLR